MTQELNEHFNERAAMEAVLTACRQEIKDRLYPETPYDALSTSAVVITDEDNKPVAAHLNISLEHVEGHDPNELKEMDERLKKIVRGNFEFIGYNLKINAVFLGKNNLIAPFLKIGHYATSAPEGQPDIVHADANRLTHWHTQNFDALKDELNEKILSEKNQITHELEPVAP